MIRLASLALLLTFAGQSSFAPVPTIRYHYSNPALSPPSWTLELHPDGSGTYSADNGPLPITVEAPLTQALFAAAAHDHYFTKPCQTARNHTAYTGDKTFSYSGPEGGGSCTFNYAQDERLNALTTQLSAVAATLEQEPHLRTGLAHDRLGLDAALQQLAEEKADGRASNMQNIAPLLRAIAADPKVLNRARATAQALLTGP